MKSIRKAKRLLVSAVLLSLSACANNPLNSPMPKAVSVNQLAGTPLPSNAHIIGENSLIFGDGETWSGRVEATLQLRAEDAVKFFIDQYPSSGWTLLSSARSKVSIIVFASKTRTLTAEISESSGFGSSSKLILTVAPLRSVGR